MNTNQTVQPPHTGLRTVETVLLILLVGFVLAVVGVTGYFRLSTETATLRESALGSLNVPWNHKVNLHVGFFTTGLVRIGSHFFKLPPEAQAGIDSIHGAEVGLYNLQGTAGVVDTGTILARADKAMSARRWDRVVGVSHEHELVAVYVPRKGLSTARMRCCVLVLQADKLVVAGASGNFDPLVEIAQQHLALKDGAQRFALR
ncbi:MAG TPA: hypothetical protein VFE51_17085 [Verrucomicrobiae bacterium]|nr:hypothetical protein [Verrucomicrobiae bacterium]